MKLVTRKEIESKVNNADFLGLAQHIQRHKPLQAPLPRKVKGFSGLMMLLTKTHVSSGHGVRVCLYVEGGDRLLKAHKRTFSEYELATSDIEALVKKLKIFFIDALEKIYPVPPVWGVGKARIEV